MDCYENNSLRDEPNSNMSASQSDNRSYISHSSYVEDIEVELREFSSKNLFKTPRKRQRLSGYDQSMLNLSKIQDTDSAILENVSSITQIFTIISII